MIETIVSEVPERAIEWNVESLPVISCDGVLVKAVFFNLLSNAVKFTCLRQVAVIHVSSSCQNGETILSVADNGVGFSQQQAGKLFTVFKRLHPCGDFPGTGVGLATVKRIIKKHGGRTWAQGEKNGGAKFHFTLLPVPADLPEIQT
ncbi:MAG: ATP-binding protein [Acidobacteriota bacterium]